MATRVIAVLSAANNVSLTISSGRQLLRGARCVHNLPDRKLLDGLPEMRQLGVIEDVVQRLGELAQGDGPQRTRFRVGADEMLAELFVQRERDMVRRVLGDRLAPQEDPLVRGVARFPTRIISERRNLQLTVVQPVHKSADRIFSFL